MKVMNFISMLLVLLLSTVVFSQSAEIDHLSQFQKKEIEKQNKSGNILLISGITATVLGGVMIASWALGDDSVKVFDGKNEPTMEPKSPALAIFGGILGGVGIALDVGGIVAKAKASKMEKEFSATASKISLYIKPNGTEFVYRF